MYLRVNLAVKLTVVVQNNFVVHPSRWLPALVFVHQFLSKLIQRNGIRDRGAESKQLNPSIYQYPASVVPT